jgi:hypothetical protein
MAHVASYRHNLLKPGLLDFGAIQRLESLWFADIWGPAGEQYNVFNRIWGERRRLCLCLVSPRVQRKSFAKRRSRIQPKQRRDPRDHAEGIGLHSLQRRSANAQRASECGSARLSDSAPDIVSSQSRIALIGSLLRCLVYPAEWQP